MNYSDTQLRKLAQQNPKELVRIITSPNGDARMLALGAEILGEEVGGESIVIPTLKQLLKHSHALVREGALNGVAAFFINKTIPRDILERIKIISNSDPLLTNKEIAADIISNSEKQ